MLLAEGSVRESNGMVLPISPLPHFFVVVAVNPHTICALYRTYINLVGFTNWHHGIVGVAMSVSW